MVSVPNYNTTVIEQKFHNWLVLIISSIYLSINPSIYIDMRAHKLITVCSSDWYLYDETNSTKKEKKSQNHLFWLEQFKKLIVERVTEIWINSTI